MTIDILKFISGFKSIGYIMLKLSKKLKAKLCAALKLTFVLLNM
jgi:hypothetical protein